MRWLRAHPPENKDLLFAMELALYKRSTWHEYFDRFTARAELDDALVSSLVPVIRAMPQELKDELLRRVPGIYDRLTSHNVRIFHFPPLIELRLAPKRAVDSFVQHALKTDERMAGWTAEGLGAKEAVDKYFGLIREKVLPSDGSRGVYDAEDLIAVGRAVQEVLRQKAHTVGVASPVITIAGSFPNGRAKEGFSDLDTQMNDRNLIELFGEMNEAVNRAVAGRHPNAQLDFQAMRPTTTEPFAAQINPAMLRITPQGIEFLVYPPFRPHFRDEAMLPINYPKPAAYLLDGKPHVPAATPERPSADGLALLKEAVESKWSAYPSQSHWREAPEKHPKTQDLIVGLSKLSGSERETAKELVANSASLPTGLKENLMLALYDGGAWHKYLDEIGSAPQSDDAVFHSMVPLIENLPEPLRDELVSRVARDYPNFSRSKQTFGWRKYNMWTFPGWVYREIAPKRAMDVFLVHALKGHEKLRQAVAEGQAPLAAYDRYLQDQKKAVFALHPNGNYRAEDVLTAARAIQKVLIEKQTLGAASPAITISGSFPAGRANLAASDIDVMTSDVGLRAALPKMTEAVAKALAPSHPEAKLDVHYMLNTTTLINAAIVSPVAIRITPDRIELIVFPTFVPKPGDKVYLDENYPPPDVFLLEQRGQTSLWSIPMRQAA